MALESYTGLLMSPKFLIKRMQGVVEKHGRQKAESSGRFKHEREAWTSAVWALGLTKLTGQQLWVEIETIEQTPDTKVHHLDKSKGHHNLQIRNLEIVDWVPQVDSVMEVIEQSPDGVPVILYIGGVGTKKRTNTLPRTQSLRRFGVSTSHFQKFGFLDPHPKGIPRFIL